MKTVELKDMDFSAFGKHVKMPDEKTPSKQGPGWKCWSFEGEINVNGKAHVGVVYTEYDPDYKVDKMERHCSREEILICPDAPIVLPVAASIDMNDEQEKPKAEDVVYVIMRPGDVVVIDKGVWHGACYSFVKNCIYYFIIENSEELTSGDVWMEIQS